MDEEATQALMTSILKGLSGAFETALSTPFSTEIVSFDAIDEAALAGLLAENTVSMEARVAGGGTLGLLFTLEEATKMASLKSTGEATASDALSDADTETLAVVAQIAISGALAELAELVGEPLEIESHEVVIREVAAAGELLASHGDGPMSSLFKFSADTHFEGMSYVLTSDVLASRVPADASEARKGSDEALVSDDEMKDILSGFTPDQESGGYSGENLPENLDVILGIDLTATARLGKIEMPIGDVLKMGPGSILEVGHLVDEPVELLINGRLIARGDVVVVDEKFGLRITEIISPRERIESLG